MQTKTPLFSLKNSSEMQIAYKKNDREQAQVSSYASKQGSD